MENRKYSILLIAFDCHYSHVARFVKYLKKTNPLVEITLFADHEDISNEIKENVNDILYRRRYVENTILKRFKPICRMMNKVLLRKQFILLSKHNHYDIVNIHFCQWYMALTNRFLHLLGSRVVITPWGSDVLRVESRFKLYLLKKVYRKADMITVGSSSPFGKTIKHIFNVDDNKMAPLAWGSETIDYINDHIDSISNADAKSELDLDGRYVITCGYNAFFQQRHETIIDAIAKVRETLPSNMVLLFPVTYGSNPRDKDEYVQLLKEKVKDLNFNAVFYEDYLSVHDIFLLRRASDMFIHVQTTDAGNSTVMEYFICGNKVLHGSWMHYKWLDFEPKFYFSVEDLDNLSNNIIDAYKSDVPVLPEDVVNVIKARGWSGKMRLWNETFISLIQ